MESFGRLGSSAQKVLRDARQRVVASDQRFAGQLGVTVYQQWQARLSCALVSGLWDGAAASWGFAGARTGLWDDVLDAAVA